MVGELNHHLTYDDLNIPNSNEPVPEHLALRHNEQNFLKIVLRTHSGSPELQDRWLPSPSRKVCTQTQLHVGP